jgi:hypothetical protein
MVAILFVVPSWNGLLSSVSLIKTLLTSLLPLAGVKKGSIFTSLFGVTQAFSEIIFFCLVEKYSSRMSRPEGLAKSTKYPRKSQYSAQGTSRARARLLKGRMENVYITDQVSKV